MRGADAPLRKLLPFWVVGWILTTGLSESRARCAQNPISPITTHIPIILASRRALYSTGFTITRIRESDK